MAGGRRPRIAPFLLVVLLSPIAAGSAFADVSVTVSGNVATALVELPDASSPLYTATVTITFDSVSNLTPDSLNLTAHLVDPTQPPVLPAQVSIDPAFPVVISVEPVVALFANGFESSQAGNGNLDFFNTYLIEIHTANLACASSTSPYRLYKAPHGSDAFADVSTDLFSGSVRARGRGGAFSQFLVVNDSRPELMLGLPILAIDKLADLSSRLNAAAIADPLRASLVNLLTAVAQALVVNDYATASAKLDQFIALVQANAGGGIANEWNADRTLSNDAGELLSLAQTLHFTLQVLQDSPLCQAPPP
jgi:hypothetical protein